MENRFNELEIAIDLEKIIISDGYNEVASLKILEKIRDCFKAKGCIWYRSMRDTDIIKTSDNIKYSDNDILISLSNNGKFIINEPCVSIPDDSRIIEFLQVYLEKFYLTSKRILELEKISRIDKLTGVYNNDTLLDFINNNSTVCNTGVAFIDVNGLGVVNNNYGHDKGDELLRGVTDIIKLYFRKEDIYRKGGDEFIVISLNIDENLFISKIQALKDNLAIDSYSASIGYVYSNELNNIKNLITIADNYMYDEKEKYREENPSKYKVLRKNKL